VSGYASLNQSFVFYDKIANACGISKGSVVNIINEMKKGFYPEFDSLLGQVDVLRDLAVKLRKLGLKASQALLATVFRRARLRFIRRILRC